jgi:alpha-tubulin suppressor-like RCC1 family protein
MRFAPKAVGWVLPLCLSLGVVSCAPAGVLRVNAVTVGDRHTCALLSKGIVSCWGYNYSGQLGNSSNSGIDVANPTPKVVGGLTGVVQVVAGADHTCALLSNGTVSCWGGNGTGELGRNPINQVPNPTPMVVGGLTDVVQIAASMGETCALVYKPVLDHTNVSPNGTVWCWGSNIAGKSGTTYTGPSPTPVEVPGLINITQITAGGDHTCALIKGGAVSCWGNNSWGEAGNTTNNGVHVLPPLPQDPPTVVAGLTDVTQVAAGNNHTCALITNRTVTCWGSNFEGQLGNTTNIDDFEAANPTPTSVAGLTDVAQITAGYDDTCALLTNSTVTCWGANGSGQSGNRVAMRDPTPLVVAGLMGVRQVVTSAQYAAHTCATLFNGTVSCWGDNTWGQLGNPTNTGHASTNPTPTRVAGLP